MSLPAAWVNRVFTRLSLVFGRDFMSRYDGLDIDDVKAEWALDLASFAQAPDAIKFALDNLPSAKPPTVLEFRDLCRKAPQYVPKALPAPPVDPTLAQELRRAFKPVVGVGDRTWATKLAKRIADKEIRPTMFQRDALREVLGSEQ
jgi:hypothetical protein